MKDGGNAADAMVATVLCIGVITMQHSGIGGGGFGLVRTPKGVYDFVDFREMAPGAATEDMYSKDINLSLFGGLASGVPGELRGLESIHTKYGKLPWKRLVMPSVKLAREGFILGKDVYLAIQSTLGGPANESFFVTKPEWAIDFAPNGTLVSLGDRMYRKRLADTLETIANNGPDAFYHGAIAEATIRTINSTGGIMTLNDLANYTTKHRETAQINYRGYKLTSTTSPSSGIVGLAALNAFQLFNDTKTAKDTSADVGRRTHRLIESTKFAYGMRTQLGDPEFVTGLKPFMSEMVSDQTAKEVHAKITDRAQNTSVYDPSGLESLNTPGTSHIVTADKDGLALSLTTTINLYFGSQVMVPETGVILNDEMNDFSTPNSSNAFGYIPTAANFIRPFKRPLSSISPTIVEKDGKIVFVAGSAGGSRIITATMQNIWHVLDDEMTAPQAIAQPRWHDQLSPNQTSLEYAYNNVTAAYLAAEGHNISYIAPGQSTAQTIRILPNGTFQAAGESRQVNSGGFAF